MVKAIVVTGYGINCEMETAHAFKLAGAEAEIVHLGKLFYGEKSLEDYQILAIPGGFSFGDDIGSAKVLANKMKHKIGEQIQKFVREEKLVIGVCNGFQALVKMGVLPGFDKVYTHQLATLTLNASGRFEDRWVYLKPNPKSHCVWTKGLEKTVYLPVRHGEGKFLVNSEGILNRLHMNNQVVLQYSTPGGSVSEKYPLNPNGSVDSIAGLCDESGRVFGLMPHPEAFLYRTNHPRWTREDLPEAGDGRLFFENAVKHAEEHL